MFKCVYCGETAKQDLNGYFYCSDCFKRMYGSNDWAKSAAKPMGKGYVPERVKGGQHGDLTIDDVFIQS